MKFKFAFCFSLIFYSNSYADYTIGSSTDCAYTVSCDTAAGTFSVKSFGGDRFNNNLTYPFILVTGMCTVSTGGFWNSVCTGVTGSAVTKSQSILINPYNTSPKNTTYSVTGEAVTDSEITANRKFDRCMKTIQTAHALGKKVYFNGMARSYLFGWWSGTHTMDAPECGISD